MSTRNYRGPVDPDVLRAESSPRIRAHPFVASRPRDHKKKNIAVSPKKTAQQSSILFSERLRERNIGVPAFRSYSPPPIVLSLTKQDDCDKVDEWLTSFEKESQKYQSFSLYCEMMLQQSAVLTDGKTHPNRLRTAIALHCMHKASGILGRYQSIMDVLWLELGSAIYVDFKDQLHLVNKDSSAKQWYTSGFTFFEQCRSLTEKVQDVKAEMADIVEENMQLKVTEKQLRAVIEENKKDLRRNLARRRSTMMVKEEPSVEDMKLIFELYESLPPEMQSKVQTKIASDHTAKVQYSQTFLDEKFKDRMDAMNREFDSRLMEAVADAKDQSFQVLNGLRTNLLDALNGLPVESPAEDSRLIQRIQTLMEKNKRKDEQIAMAAAEIDSVHVRRIETDLTFEYDQLKEEYRQFKQIYWALHDQKQAYHEQLKALRDKATVSIGFQVDDLEIAAAMDKMNQHIYCVGLRAIITDYKISASQAKKIASKRKLATPAELNVSIGNLYCAKMLQDIQDDNALKHRESLSNFIRDTYTLQYGLKALAINQIVLLDAAIKKHIDESPRVRVFGMLVGSIAPESNASSKQACDFILFALGAIFNVGHYTRNRKNAVTGIKKLKTLLMDGESVCFIPLDKAIQTIRIVFILAAARVDNLIELFKAKANNDKMLALDEVLEAILLQWVELFKLETDAIRKVYQKLEGSLTFDAFKKVVENVDPEITNRDVLRMYNKVADQENQISEDDFVEAILSHQSKMIMEKQMRSSSKAPPPQAHERYLELLKSTDDDGNTISEDSVDTAMELLNRLPTLSQKFSTSVRRKFTALKMFSSSRKESTATTVSESFDG